KILDSCFRRNDNLDGFVTSPSAALRFTFVAAAYPPSTPHSGGLARRVPRNAGELFTKPSLWRLITRSSTLNKLAQLPPVANSQIDT
ncbi:MAG: hypothetical protein NTY64_08265, partial [Deltaproteobacteria bacterium]|nr:hypothetical protein [Deltaproteobacteria bacterium]